MSDNDKQETIADIIAEMREIHVAEFQDYSDRLEAAHRRELAAGGDAAKLREALKAAELGLFRWLSGSISRDEHRELVATIKTALAAPPRQCDLMDWRTAWKTWREKFHPETPVGYSAVVKGTEAFMDWFTAPATEKEGGAK